MGSPCVETAACCNNNCNQGRGCPLRGAADERKPRPGLLARLARIDNDLVRFLLLIHVLPVHFVGRLLDAALADVRMLGERALYRHLGLVYLAMLQGALVPKP